MKLTFERQFDWSNRNRLYVVRWFEGWRFWGIHLQYGNTNGDPVWTIGFTFNAWKPKA